jgi:formylglycine-generating enzyme required for sulfatase activity
MLKGFISYAHDDYAAFNEMRTHLRAVERAFEIEFWADKRIKAGNYWSPKIADAIEAAHIHVLMFSPAFISSDYIFDHELAAINDKRAKGDLVLPVVIKRCAWSRFVGELQGVPLDHTGRLLPVFDWQPRRNGYDAVREQIGAAIAKTFNLKHGTEPLPSQLGPQALPKLASEYDRANSKSAAVAKAPNGDSADTDLRQLPAAFRFRIQNDKIDVLPEQADVTDFDVAKDLYAELIAKANSLRSRLADTNADQRAQRSVGRLLDALGARIEDVRPGILLSRSRSIEADRNAFDTEDARRELFPDAIAMVEDVLLSLQDLLAIYPIVRKIEAERLALSIQRDETLLAAVKRELEAIKEEASASDAVTKAAVAALKENDPEIEAARTVDERAAQMADQLLVARNFGSVAVNYVRKHGAAAATVVGAGLVRASSELKELGGKSWEAAKANLPEGVGAAARILPVGLVIVLLTNIAGPIAGLAALSGGFKQLTKAIKKLKDIGELPKERKPDREIATTPKSQRRNLFVAPEMIEVPPGEFLMGSPGDEGYQYERPRHEVTIKNPFAVSISPVTRGEFAAFVRATKHKIKGKKPSWRDPGFPQDDDHPVVCVSWHDAQAYVAWLRERSGGEAYRLLSEVEWEYCCRAGTTSAYSTGESITAEQANFGENAKGTTSVFRFPPNPWGLRDMHGNVWEWCDDNWHEDYKGNPPTDGRVWAGGDASLRVLRGGSWGSNPQVLRSAYRYRFHPDGRDFNVGFRVASTLCAGAGGITVPPGAYKKRSGPFMMSMVGARVEMGVRYRGSACPGRHMGSGRRSRPSDLGRIISHAPSRAIVHR